MRRRALLSLALGVLAVGCAGAHRARQPGPLVTTVAVSSIETVYGIQGRLEGTATVRDDWIYVVVPTGAVRTYQLDGQEYWDLRIRAGLATCTADGQWHISSENRAVRLAPLLGLTQAAATLDTTTRTFRDTLRMDLGVPRGTELERAWVAFTFEWPFQNVLATYIVCTPALRSRHPTHNGSPTKRTQARGAVA